MKKFYTLALATALTAVAATAATPVLKTEISRQKSETALNLHQAIEKGISMKKVMRANDTYTIEGTYTLTLDDVYFEDGAGAGVTTDVEITNNMDGSITLSSSYFPGDIIAGYNATTNEISFSNLEYGAANLGGSTYYVRFEPGIWDSSINNVRNTPFSVTFNTNNGTIIFPADHNFAWIAYQSSNYTSRAGYLDLFDVISLVPSEPFDEEQAGQWTPVGNAIMEDAWVLAAYQVDGVGINPADYPFEVELQQNVDNENLYRLWAPYHSPQFPLESQNASSYQGQIVFDVTDPDHVRFFPGYPAGFKGQSGEMYCFDLLGWQIWMYGDEYDDSYFDDIISFMEQNGQPFSTFEDGVVKVNLSTFDISPNCTKAYTWQNINYYITTITFPSNSVAGIAAEEGAPVYFNMQGMRVENPAAGELVIRVQNGKTSKMIAK